MEEDKKSMTLAELREMVAGEVDEAGTDYSATNIIMEMQHKLGNIAKFGLKKRLAQKGIGKDDPAVGLEKFKVEVGQMLWCLDAVCLRNGVDSLDVCRDAAHAHLLKKRA